MAVSVEQTLKYRTPIWMHVDAEGLWNNRRKDAVFICPTPHVASFEQVQAETAESFFFEYTPRAGDVVVDVGAGIGDDALVLSRLVGPTGRVIAIEAHPRTFRCLQKSVAANHLTNVTAFNLAVTDVEGEVTMSDDANFQSNAIGVSGGVAVRARRLDSILADSGITHVDFLKMNIEGAETGALLGMPRALALTSHIAISAHDFKADRGEGESFRTHDGVTQTLRSAGFDTVSRANDPRPVIRFYVYGRKRPADALRTVSASL